jgi:hypothetical protein
LQFQHSTSSDLTLVEANLSEYKTATGERRAILLPLIALGCGLDAFSWSAEWRLARQRSGADGMAFLMCADDHNGEAWLTRRMTTAEGSFWLKDVLIMLDTNADHTAAYSTHSLKATCLSWVRFRACLNLFFLVFFFISVFFLSPSWLNWYGVNVVALTDCRWWFDSPLVRE